jgi:hypothetical protein
LLVKAYLRKSSRIFLVRILFAKFTAYKTATFLTQSRWHSLAERTHIRKTKLKNYPKL